MLLSLMFFSSESFDFSNFNWFHFSENSKLIFVFNYLHRIKIVTIFESIVSFLGNKNIISALNIYWSYEHLMTTIN